MKIYFNNRDNYRKRKGFSLAEVLFAIALMAFVSLAAIGGMVVITRVRDTIDKQTKANMIMIATVEYIRRDLNCCTNPHTMDCSQFSSLYDLYTDNKDKVTIYNSQAGDFGKDFFYLDPAEDSSKCRYISVIIRNKVFTTLGTTTCGAPAVQYCNINEGTYYNGICVGINYSSVSSPVAYPGYKISGNEFDKNVFTRRKYIIAQNVMLGTGMYSRIKDGLITWDEEEMLFKFTIEVVDEETGQVVLSQFVEVCPDTLIPD